MPQDQNDKFMELSPVLELVYIMLTNMAKYLDVYATDIDASQLSQYEEAKKSLAQTIKVFDGLYGLQSGTAAASAVADDMEEDDISVGDDMGTRSAVPAQAPVQQPPARPDDKKPYEFASGDDPESLRKAKQAVEELKSLFADMKKKETPAQQPTMSAPQPVANPASMVHAPAMTVPTPYAAPMPATPQHVPPAPMPTFVDSQAMPQPADASPMHSVVTPAADPAPTANAPVVPAQQDASEIDSILSELRKLQNKGAQQL